MSFAASCNSTYNLFIDTRPKVTCGNAGGASKDQAIQYKHGKRISTSGVSGQLLGREFRTHPEGGGGDRRRTVEWHVPGIGRGNRRTQAPLAGASHQDRPASTHARAISDQRVGHFDSGDVPAGDGGGQLAWSWPVLMLHPPLGRFRAIARPWYIRCRLPRGPVYLCALPRIREAIRHFVVRALAAPAGAAVSLYGGPVFSNRAEGALETRVAGGGPAQVRRPLGSRNHRCAGAAQRQYVSRCRRPSFLSAAPTKSQCMPDCCAMSRSASTTPSSMLFKPQT